MRVALVATYAYPLALGLRYIAAFLKRRGDEVEMFFMRSKRATAEADFSRALLEELAEGLRTADLIGMSLMTNTFHRARVLTETIRAAGLRAPVMWAAPDHGQRPDFAPGKFQSRVDRLNVRLAKLAAEEHLDADTHRLMKRLGKYAEYIFTFLDYADVAFENNFAERQIRPAVILRKNSQSNRSDRGAATQAVLMSVYRTLELRGLNPTKTIAHTLRTYLATGQLPPLPDTDIADG